jgi:hypothetical protein
MNKPITPFDSPYLPQWYRGFQRWKVSKSNVHYFNHRQKTTVCYLVAGCIAEIYFLEAILQKKPAQNTIFMAQSPYP